MSPIISNNFVVNISENQVILIILKVVNEWKSFKDANQ